MRLNGLSLKRYMVRSSNQQYRSPLRSAGWLFICVIILAACQQRVEIQPIPVRGERPYQDLYRISAEAAQNGWTAAAHREVGELYYELGDLENAAGHWQAALLSEPQNLNLLRRLAETYLTLEEWTSAADTLRKLLRIIPNELWAHYRLGLILAPLNAQDAIFHLEQVETTPAYGEIATRLVLVLRSTLDEAPKAMQIGIVLSEHEQWAEAEAAFLQAAELGYPDPVAMAYVGFARGMQGKFGESWIQQAVAIDPVNATVRYLEGLYLRGRGEYAKSIDAFSLAIAFEPDNPAYYVELGSTYRKISDLSSASRWLQQAVVISDYDPEFQNILSDFYLEEGAELAAAGIENPPAGLQNADAEADVGWTLYRVGAVEEASAAFEKALAIEATNPRALFYKARVAIDTGNIDSARTLLQQVIDQGEDFAAEAQSLLDTLSS
jgi:protein O-GlcNAc transferase